MVGLSKHTFILSTLVYLAVCSPVKRRAAPLPPVVQSSSSVTNATLTFAWPIKRDGGGGGTIAGKHIINFSDTSILNADDFKSWGFYPFVSNTIATTSADGKTLTDYGDGYAEQQWPFATTATPIDGIKSENAPKGYRTAIWPNTNIITGCDGECGYTVSNVINVTDSPLKFETLYSTVANITIGPKGPSVTREAVKMWYPDETNYGLYGLARARDGTNDIFLLAAPSGALGVKVARVAEASIAVKAAYKYWDGSTWSITAPAATDTSANIFNYDSGGYGVGTGDIFWSEYFHTWLAVFNDAFTVDDTFRLMYSTNGHMVGPWSTVSENIYTTKACPSDNGNCNYGYNYATHAYPNIDPTGKTLLLSWAYNGAITQFTTITFQ